MFNIYTFTAVILDRCHQLLFWLGLYFVLVPAASLLAYIYILRIKESGKIALNKTIQEPSRSFH